MVHGKMDEQSKLSRVSVVLGQLVELLTLPPARIYVSIYVLIESIIV